MWKGFFFVVVFFSVTKFGGWGEGRGGGRFKIYNRDKKDESKQNLKAAKNESEATSN